MTVSRNSLIYFTFLVGFAAFWTAWPALAEDEPVANGPLPAPTPLILTPRPADAPTTGPGWIGPADSGPRGDVQPPSTKGPLPPEDTLVKMPGDDDVLASDLAPPDLDEMGLQSAQQAGLSRLLWQGSDAIDLASWMTLVQRPGRSVVGQGLLRQLLTSAATPPRGGMNGQFFADRLRTLLAAGEVPAFMALVESVPLQNVPIDVAQQAAIADLLVNRLPQACNRIRLASSDATDFFWFRALAVCQISEGDTAGAGLTVSLLRERGLDDPLFFALADGLIIGSKPKSSMTPQDVVHLTLLRLADAKLSAEDVAQMPVALLYGALTAGQVSDAALPQAHLRVVQNVALPVEQGRVFLLGLGNELSQALADLAIAFDQSQRVSLVRTAITAARADDLLLQVAPHLAPHVQQLSPSPDLMDLTPDLLRVLALAGDFNQMAAWRDALIAADDPDGQLLNARRAVFPVLAIADALPPGDWQPGLTAFLAGTDTRPAPNTHQQQLLFSLMEAFGYVVPRQVWAASVTGVPPELQPRHADSALWHSVVAAADKRRQGEALLLTVAALADGDAGDTHPALLQNLVTALAMVGRAPLAKALAIEAVVAAGM